MSAYCVPCVSMDDNLSADGVGNLTRDGHYWPKTLAERRINKCLDEWLIIEDCRKTIG
jgi:hypothetical protein